MKKTCVTESTIDTTSEVCQEVETDAQEIVEASKTEDKEVNIDVAPCVAIITKDKQEVETSENVTTCENIEREGQIEVAPAVVTPEIIKSEVMENTETEIKVIEKTVDEKVIEPNSPPTVIDSEIKKVEITEIQNAPETEKSETKDIVKNTKKEETMIPDENIEDEVFSSEEHKNEKEKHKVLCNHVGSETGSYSSDSSDDENVCGSYHVESPLDEKTHKMKVETIVEEQSETRMNGEVSEVSTEETKLVNVSETNAENISNNVSGVENAIEELTEIKKGEENNTRIENEKDDETTEGKVIAGQNEDENNERKVDEKRDFDIVVSEQKTVSPDGNQIISVRSERRTETIQKEVFTHTRRELKPEEFALYEKEIEAADRRNKIQTEGIKEITDIDVVESEGKKPNTEPEQIKEIKTQTESGEIQEIKTQTESEGIQEIKIQTESEEIKEIKTKTESEEVKEIEKTEVENPEDDVVEVKIVKSDKTLEENVKKMKYIDESSGDSGSVKIKQNEEAPEVVTTIVNEEAGKDLENEAPKLNKKESMRLKKEEKERKKKELAEEKERLKREKQEEKERLKKEKQELKEQKKREKERKKKEKEEAESKKKKDDKNDVKPGIEETQEENKDVEQKKENVEHAEESKPKEEVEERVPTAIAFVMAKQKEEEKMEEIDLNDEPAVEEVPKEEPPIEKNKKRKKSKKDKKEKEHKTPQNKKKHKTTGCFAFSAVPSSDEEEEVKVQEEVKEEIVQEVHMFIYFQVQVMIGK